MSKQTIIAATGKHHTASIIFSHGLGDTAGQFQFQFHSLSLLLSLIDYYSLMRSSILSLEAGWAPFAHSVKSKFPHIKWILPTASSQPVTLNGGMPMPSWCVYTVLWILHASNRSSSHLISFRYHWQVRYSFFSPSNTRLRFNRRRSRNAHFLTKNITIHLWRSGGWNPFR